MVENKCSQCGKQQQYTIAVKTDKKYDPNDDPPRVNSSLNSISQIVEHWCFRCLFLKQPPMGNREEIISTEKEIQEEWERRGWRVRMSGNPSGKIPED